MTPDGFALCRSFSTSLIFIQVVRQRHPNRIPRPRSTPGWWLSFPLNLSPFQFPPLPSLRSLEISRPFLPPACATGLGRGPHPSLVFFSRTVPPRVFFPRVRGLSWVPERRQLFPPLPNFPAEFFRAFPWSAKSKPWNMAKVITDVFSCAPFMRPDLAKPHWTSPFLATCRKPLMFLR